MKLTINSCTVNGVPLNEYFIENQEPKKLIFIQHGYLSNKEYGTDYLALTLARRGYLVVSIDAYLHGERLGYPYDTEEESLKLKMSPIVVRRTAIDIIKLHRLRYREFSSYDFIGISMGAMIAYYLATKTDKINKLVPVIGTMDFMYQADVHIRNYGFKVGEFMDESMKEYLLRMNPIRKVHKMKYNELYAFVGKNDKVVPMEPTVKFFDKSKDDNMHLFVFDDSHNVNREMQLKIFEVIEK